MKWYYIQFDPSRGSKCDCGADKYNAELDATLAAIRAELEKDNATR